MGHNGEALFSIAYYSYKISLEISHLADRVFIRYRDALRNIWQINLDVQ